MGPRVFHSAATALFADSLYSDAAFPLRFFIPSWSLAYELYYYIAFIAIVGSDFSDKFLGNGISKVKKLFKTARANAPVWRWVRGWKPGSRDMRRQVDPWSRARGRWG